MNISIETSFIDKEMTGVGYYTYNLAKQLSKLETTHKIYFFFDNVVKLSKSYDLPFKKTQIICPGKRRKYLFFRSKKIDNILNNIFYRDTRKILNKIDIFHCTNYEIPDFISRNKLKCKTVLTVYDLSFVLYPNFFTDEAKRRTQDRYISATKATFIITISNSSKMDIIKHWHISEHRIKVIYPGFDSTYFHPYGDNDNGILQKYGLHNEKYILFVGTLEPRKNICKLIEVFRIIKTDYSDMKLVLIGKKGWLFEPIFKKMRDSGVDKDIVHIGYVQIEELPIFYRKASVFVYPSVYEGFGLPPLEAMACGCPVIASNTSSLPEVIEDAGILVNPDNTTEELADAIKRVLCSKNLRIKLKEKGLIQAKKFSWEKTVTETIKVYEEMIKI